MKLGVNDSAKRDAVVATPMLYNVFILGGGYFTPNLRWYIIQYYGVMLLWNAHELAQLGVENITVTAGQLPGSNVTIEVNVSVHIGKAFIYGLSPFTYYRMVATGHGKEGVIFSSERFIRTQPTGKSHFSHIFSISIPAIKAMPMRYNSVGVEA